jgi:hypothetical protein
MTKASTIRRKNAGLGTAVSSRLRGGRMPILAYDAQPLVRSPPRV